MKEKLELKHINPYSDKALKGLFHGVEDIVTGIDYEFGIISSLNTGSVLIRDFKPLLHPLDRFTDEFKSKYHFYYAHEGGFQLKAKNELYTRLDDLEYLFRNHFDVFGLIEKGLAEPIKI